MASYGTNFRRLRGPESQEEIARRLKLRRQANISAIELGSKVPSVRTIVKHAAALKCTPAELLEGVQTDYDRLRNGTYAQTAPVSRKARQKARQADGINRFARNVETSVSVDRSANASGADRQHAAKTHTTPPGGRAPLRKPHR